MSNPPDAPPSIRLLCNGAEAFPAWLAAIRGAKSEVLLEMYWFASDKTGHAFADALKERASAGVEVLVIYDAVGSLGTDAGMLREMAEAGVHLREFNPITPWRKRFRLNVVGIRDHRKIIVVDGEVGFTGGINITDRAAPECDGGGAWRDAAVEVRGPPVTELRALFFDTWRRVRGSRPRIAAPPVRDVPSRNRAMAQQTGLQGAPRPGPLEQTVERLARNPKLPALPMSKKPPEVAPAVQIFGHSSWGSARTLRNVYERAFRSAKRRIHLENAYFIPDLRLLSALKAAARRGVDVRVVVPRFSDVPSVAWASRALFKQLLKAGVHVHEWTAAMLHAKVAVIDDWATVGSYNLDYRSLRYQLEVAAGTHDPDFVATLEASITKGLEHTEELSLAEWNKRPWWWRVLEWGHFLVRKML